MVVTEIVLHAAHYMGNEAEVSTIAAVLEELSRNLKKYDQFNSSHEAYGVLKEEVKEFEDHVFTNQKNRDVAAMRTELLQVAAVALRHAIELCDESRGRR